MLNFRKKLIAYIAFLVSVGLPILGFIVRTIEGSFNMEFMAIFVLYYMIIALPLNSFLMWVAKMEKEDFIELNGIALSFFKVLKALFSTMDKAKSP